MGVGTILLFALPQLVGWLVTRLLRRSSWVSWPAIAVVVFSTLWYGMCWLPAHHRTGSPGCGTMMLVAVDSARWFLAAGLVGHVTVGTIFGMRARRRQRA